MIFRCTIFSPPPGRKTVRIKRESTRQAPARCDANRHDTSAINWRLSLTVSRAARGAHAYGIFIYSRVLTCHGRVAYEILCHVVDTVGLYFVYAFIVRLSKTDWFMSVRFSSLGLLRPSGVPLGGDICQLPWGRIIIT